jgi:hypothetical protein
MQLLYKYIIMEDKDEIILNWENNYNNYIKIENECNIKINKIIEMKNNLLHILNNQRQDDVIFYKAIIENSCFYLTKSLKIRKIKLLNDIKTINKQLNKNEDEDDSINIDNIFTIFIKNFKKIYDEINEDIKNKTNLKWVKEDNIRDLTIVINNMMNILEYHYKILNNFTKIVDIEYNFYCNDNTKERIELLTIDTPEINKFDNI